MSVININTKRPDRIWELLADSPVGSQLMRIADQLFGEVADTMAYAWTLDRDNHLAALRDLQEKLGLLHQTLKEEIDLEIAEALAQR